MFILKGILMHILMNRRCASLLVKQFIVSIKQPSLHFIVSLNMGNFCLPYSAISCCFSADILQAKRIGDYECALLSFNSILVSDL